MIYYSNPYDLSKNIGKYNNEFLGMLPNNDDFACFTDGDTMFTTSDYGQQIYEVTQRYPDIRYFTCYTNRLGCKAQVLPGVDQDNNDMDYHKKMGKALQTIYGTQAKDITKLEENVYVSACMTMIRKDLWKKIGYFSEDGMLGIDNDYHKRILQLDEKIYLMLGVYIYHWYRWPNLKDKTHLI
jgi:GT2 family glycosyltransferase